jgi:hypothetical protein
LIRFVGGCGNDQPTVDVDRGFYSMYRADAMHRTIASFGVGALCLLVGSTTGCGASFSPAPVASEPAGPGSSERDGDALRAEAAASLHREVVVDAYKRQAASAPAEAPYDDTSSWGRAFTEMIRPHAATTQTSAPLQCAASEIARFLGTRSGMPSRGLLRFMAASCGVSSANVLPLVWVGAMRGAVQEDAIVQQAQADLSSRLGAALVRGRHLVGLAAWTAPDRAVAVLAVADDAVRFDRSDHPVDEKGRALLEGRFTEEGAHVLRAYVNRGSFGIAPCDPRTDVPLPRFAFACDVGGESAPAWVEIIEQRPGQHFAVALAQALVHRGEPAGVEYVRHPVGPPAPASTPEEFSTRVAERLASVRKQAGLPELSPSAAQGGENANRAPAFFGEDGTLDEAAGDSAAEGVLAGTAIQGDIREGWLFVEPGGVSRDGASWLESALDTPLGRLTLLARDARDLAIGSAFLKDGAVATVASTYAVFTSEDHTPDEAALVELVSKLRVEHGRPAVVRVREVDAMHREADLVAHQGKDLNQALGAMVQAAARTVRGSVQGYFVTGPSIDELELPWQLAQDGPLRMMVRVTHRRVAGQAWGELVAFVIVVPR